MNAIKSHDERALYLAHAHSICYKQAAKYRTTTFSLTITGGGGGGGGGWGGGVAYIFYFHFENTKL